jgi:hypothetical protein
MIDVNTVGFDDLLELVDKRLTGGLNTENPVNLDHVIAISFFGIDLEMRKTFSEI